MRPPMPRDHVAERRLRVVMLQKHAPYNKGEERGVPESTARRLCVIGVAIPAPKDPRGIRKRNEETGEMELVEDTLGGWTLSRDEKAAASQFNKSSKQTAGDFKGERAMDEMAAAREETRVENEFEKDDKKPGGFLKAGKKEAPNIATSTKTSEKK